MGKNKDRSSILERLQKIIVDTLEIPPERVTPEARFREDLGADSLDMVEMTLAVEREFKADVIQHIDESWGDTLDACLGEVTTVGEAVEFLELLAPLCCSRPVFADESQTHKRELAFRAALWLSPHPEERILALLMTDKLPEEELGWLC